MVRLGVFHVGTRVTRRPATGFRVYIKDGALEPKATKAKPRGRLVKR